MSRSASVRHLCGNQSIPNQFANEHFGPVIIIIMFHIRLESIGRPFSSIPTSKMIHIMANSNYHVDPGRSRLAVKKLVLCWLMVGRHVSAYGQACVGLWWPELCRLMVGGPVSVLDSTCSRVQNRHKIYILLKMYSF